jgi:uncharacterized glyoxalase superfamily protein PhnB
MASPAPKQDETPTVCPPAEETASQIDYSTAPKPAVLGGVAPYLTVDGATKAAEFYVRAFGAQEVARHPLDGQGRTMHIHLHLNGGSLMLSDAYPEYGHPWKAPEGFALHLKVDDIDAAWARAIEAGATEVMPVQLMFWGERYGQLRDPFGVMWSMGAEVPPQA